MTVVDRQVAAQILERFERTVKLVAYGVADTFPAVTELDDTEQEARILILSYAGLVDGGRLPDQLAKAEFLSNGDESQIQRLIATQLRMDLNQIFGRERDKHLPTTPLDNIPENYLPAAFDVRESIKSDSEFRRFYPTLAAWLLDDLTHEDIADMGTVSVRTVERHIAKEKRAYLTRYAQKGGLRVEGDETLDELQEACAHLKASGR